MSVVGSLYVTCMVLAHQSVHPYRYLQGSSTVMCSVIQSFCAFLPAVECEPSGRFLTPFFGNMLGGTAITLTMARGCLEQISGTPVCVFGDTVTAAAVDDSGLATSGQHYFCTLPMFERADFLSFEFRAQLKTAGHGRLSLFDNFFLCKCLPRSRCVITNTYVTQQSVHVLFLLNIILSWLTIILLNHSLYHDSLQQKLYIQCVALATLLKLHQPRVIWDLSICQTF